MQRTVILAPRRALQSVALIWFALATVTYLGYSLSSILTWAPHALYADQWRQYLDYVRLPFPQNILHPDNGHRSVVPNLIAWIELMCCDGNQWLQIGLGLLAMLSAVVAIAIICLRDRDVSIPQRAAGVFLGVFAIFWLGHARTLFHSTELVHTSLPIACLVLAGYACIAATRNDSSGHSVHRPGLLVAALALAVIATFSFGYGIGVFVSIAAMLIARKASSSQVGAALAGLAVMAGLYFMMPGGDGVRGVLTIAPAENLLIGARWLGAPFVTLFTYLWNPEASGLVWNGVLRANVHQFAEFASRHLPDLGTSVQPYATFGALGMIALLWASARRLRSRAPAGMMEALGLGIAWFGLVAAGIVSVSRLTGFQMYPGQIYADRYLPWPCLFWLGLALIALSAPRTLLARCTVVFALLLPVLGWPTQFGGQIFAALTRGLIENTADGSVVGVIERGTSLGETEPDQFVRSLPVLRRLRVAQFATPAAALIGRNPPAGSHSLPDSVIAVRPVDDNLIGGAGSAIVLRVPKMKSEPGEPLLLVDGSGIVVGLASNDARLSPPGYSGYANCSPCSGGLRAVVLDR